MEMRSLVDVCDASFVNTAHLQRIAVDCCASDSSEAINKQTEEITHPIYNVPDDAITTANDIEIEVRFK